MIAKPEQTMRVVALNLNGIRSSVEKGVLEWLHQYHVDIACLQETRIGHDKWGDHLKPADWHCHLYAAQKPGYAGTGIYSRVPWQGLETGLGFDICDQEGRWSAADFQLSNGETVTIVSAYFPSGSSSPEAQARKDVFLQHLMPKLKAWQQQGRHMIICGDVNIAHQQIDIKNWKGNLKNSGFLPHERAWVDELLAHGFVDAFRHLNPHPDEYSWWSNRGQAWAKNVGWRIDYQFITESLRDRIQQVGIYRDARFSDHAPVIVDYKW